ncbi:uncharacterized protein with PIN domain [Methanococcus maripaludis]|uniref:Uncharacterized protein with PIN domain n=1 Tax=Methanococcus maripaludis TaxID=39152 RepID=A0A7J9NX18_METMI|nr:hypothetical protein [Methanococcus maripaludis]MBA2851795.1 uncharacterized protein with PIN domain [Methanococcus maripaludis]
MKTIILDFIKTHDINLPIKDEDIHDVYDKMMDTPTIQAGLFALLGDVSSEYKRCPHCQSVINTLIQEYGAGAQCECKLGEDGDMDFGETLPGDASTESYNCPACGRVICTHDDDAVAFFKTGIAEVE